MLNNDPHGVKKLIVDLLTESKGAVFGLFKGLFDGYTYRRMAHKAQILSQHTARRQVQGIVISYFLVVHTAVFCGGEIMNVLGVIA